MDRVKILVFILPSWHGTCALLTVMKSSYFLLVVFVGFIQFSSCKDSEPDPDPDPDPRDNGTITGQDFRRCACCGGWFIEIDEEVYRFTAIPFSTNVDLFNQEFPIEVFVDWSPQEDACLGDEIDVISLDLVQ